MRTQRPVSAVATAVMLGTLLLGCGDRSSPNPIAPTSVTAASTPTPAPPAVLYAVSGLVFEVTAAGRTPVEGVEVYCDPCGPPLGHSARHTDASGVYSFDGDGGVASGRIELLLAKQGYKLPDKPDQSGPSGLGWMGTVGVTVAGDTRADIEIVRK